MASIVKSFSILGVEGYVVDVEVKEITGQPMMLIVGLGDTAVKEARERVQAAINDSNYTFPQKKIVINLAPSDLKKSGSHFDLSIAMGLLFETGQINKTRKEEFAFIGELSLNAKLRAVSGVLPMIIAAKENGIKNVIVPIENVMEASLVNGVNIFGFNNLIEVIEFLECRRDYEAEEIISIDEDEDRFSLDFRDVQGQDGIN